MDITPPMVDTTAQLRDVLSYLFDDEASASIVARDVGLDTRQIRSDGTIYHYWDAILNEARKQNLTDALLQYAIERYPRNPTLQKLAQRYWAAQQEIAPPVLSRVRAELLAELVTILSELPITETFLGRTNLLSDIPGADKLNRLEYSKQGDLQLILNQLDRLGCLADGRWPLIILLDGVLPGVQSFKLGNDLTELRDKLVQVYAGD